MTYVDADPAVELAALERSRHRTPASRPTLSLSLFLTQSCAAQGFYLPFCLLAFSVMVGGNWVADVLGILGGHLYYFLKACCAHCQTCCFACPDGGRTRRGARPELCGTPVDAPAARRAIVTGSVTC